MRVRLSTGLIGALAAAIVAMVLGEPLAQESQKSVWSGIYTPQQAERGAAGYAQNCQKCHGAQLQGLGEAKPLTGSEFLSNWNGLTVGDLFDRVRTTMPLDNPRALTREAYADILAYVLKFNGFPAGPAEMDHRTEVLAGIRFDAFRASAARGSLLAHAFAEPVPNSQPNPYVAQPGFLAFPAGRSAGSTSGVAVDSQGHIWVADRCAANSCDGSDLDPVLEFASNGAFIKSFGKGLMVFPHGLFVDGHDRIWVTCAQAKDGRGAQVFAFDSQGHRLMTLGKAGISREGPDTFSEPNAVIVARDGTILVADGHSPGKGPARIVRFDAKGKFLGQWGTRGPARGQMEVPHTLAMDSKGRLFVGDRWNNRIDIFTPEGKLLDVWTQFGRPSGIYIDKADRIYVADSESRARDGYGHNPGWKRGIRVGDARTGAVTAFIPDTETDPESQATSGPEGVWADSHGVIYGAQVLRKGVMRYLPPSKP